MKNTQKKKPSDYPQLTCRMPQKDKAKIDKLVDKLVKRAEKNRVDGELQVRRNHILTDALIIGLESMVNNGK